MLHDKRLGKEKRLAYFTYACKDYPGMDPCPGRFEAATEDELWMHIDTHASVAHGEDPVSWPPEERETIGALIKTG